MESFLPSTTADAPSSNKRKIALVSIIALLGVIGTIAYVSSNSTPSYSFLEFDAEESEFQDFIVKYNKEYTDEEYLIRLPIFKENLDFIRTQNSLNLDWVLGVNHFADLTKEEFRSIYLSNRLTSDNRNGVTLQIVGALPATIDWRTQGAVTPVKNQGNCGSCWAFSASGAVEGAWKIFNGTLPTLSEQELMDCSKGFGNGGCNGGEMQFAFQYIIKNGITSEVNYPYTAKNGKCNVKLESYQVAELSAYVNVTVNNVTALQTAVAMTPVSVGVEADQTAWQYYKGGILTSNCGTKLDHGVLIVGYNMINNPTFWIVKNSWGMDWGEQGYIRIAVKTGDGLCGINMDASYPIPRNFTN